MTRMQIPISIPVSWLLWFESELRLDKSASPLEIYKIEKERSQEEADKGVVGKKKALTHAEI